jgi:DNA polymerase (family X)
MSMPWSQESFTFSQGPAQVLANDDVASALDEVADLLAATGANAHRVRAFCSGAQTLRELETPVAALLAAEGHAGLERLPGIGEGLAHAIEELAMRGRLPLLERLRGEVSPEALFATLPGIGPELAAHLHGDLGVTSLEDLEVAAHDGRLLAVPGFGPRRVRAVTDSIAALLGRQGSRRHRMRAAPPTVRPPVATLLAVDERYRREAAAGALPRIAPRRFNPDHRAWLPILHDDRDGFSFTALFSNTALAHRLGRTDDWVVIFWGRGGVELGQCTVVTERRGLRAGRRVVRGRERESPF